MEPHRQGPVLIIGALGVQRPGGAQARPGGREEGEGHLDKKISLDDCILRIR